MQKIQTTQKFLTSLKEKHLLLDTNFFRDVAVKPTIYNDFINELKSSDVTLATIDLVKYELLKGSSNRDKYDAKIKLIDDIVDVIIPLSAQTYSEVYKLIIEYGIEGTPVGITDLFLGAVLKQYGQNIFLLTRDTTDFIQRIFELNSIVNVPRSKGIFTYGIYQYKS